MKATIFSLLLISQLCFGESSADKLLTNEKFSAVLVSPLFEGFEGTLFPPIQWVVQNPSAGTVYWTRASTGSSGVASAKFDFWTAPNTLLPQSLVSARFTEVTSSNNYLRFDYSAAYYSASNIDSCIIETSTDLGLTWTRLLAMYQSSTVSSGVNSSPIMSTVIGTLSDPFTPTASQWATKILVMPVGTNVIRFVAKSAYGNNLYIDNISSGPNVGVGTILTLTPEKFELAQNYPNPFNPSTNINFSLPKQSFVTLRIFDIMGREVAKLLNEIKPTGVYSVDFNGADFDSGVYFYRIEASDFVDTKRMVLVK